MSKKKTIILAIAAIAILVSVLGILCLVNKRSDNAESYFTILGMGCDAISYEQDGEIGYLTLNDGVREFVVKVSDADLQNSLITADLSNVIGGSVGIAITDEFVEENHLHIADGYDIYHYFYSGTFDDYLVLVEVHYK